MLPDDVTGEELDLDARAELRTLPKDLAARVARHLVMAGRLAEDDPETAYKHARAARRLASRVGLVREAAGLAAYYAGEWSEALQELRAARRLSTSEDAYLPVMADCERGLGRPERALDLVRSPEAKKLDQMGRVELHIVESGARRDLGQLDAAVVTLQLPELRDRRLRPWSARLFYAYADALAEAGRGEEASDWFARAAAADRDGETDAAERYAELEGLDIFDTEEDEDGSLIEREAEPTAAIEPESSPEAAEHDEVAPGESVEPAAVAAETVVPEVDDVVSDAEGAEADDVETEVPAEVSAAAEGVVSEASTDDGVVEDAPAPLPEIVAATAIEFKPAEPELLELAETAEDGPEAVVFLEPAPSEEEQRPPAE